MSCCNCCENTLNLGCFNPCGLQFVTGATVPSSEAGTWSLFIKFQRRLYAFNNTLIEGQEINFTVGCLDANHEFEAYITKPDGAKALFTKDSIEYDCFAFSTKINALQGIEVNADSIT